MKIKRIDGCQIIIDVEEPWVISKKTPTEIAGEYNKTARSLIADIKRHVDGCESIDCKINSTDICSLCGNEWETYTEEDEKVDPEWPTGMPDCCAKAQEEWLKEKND